MPRPVCFPETTALVSTDPAVLLLHVDDQLLARAPDVYGHDAATRLRSLAESLRTSPPWHRAGAGARLVMRAEPAPVLALVDRVDAPDRPLMDALGWQVQDSLRRLHPVPYLEAERLCTVLAERLTQRLGEARVRSSAFVGVPRGGLVVAGLLAYALDLSHDQLVHEPMSSGDLVVVDDCVLSGARTRRWLAGHAGDPVVLAHLHSHSDLRRAAEQDVRIDACVAAADLHDHAPQQQGDRYETWRANWAERSPDDFWTGHPDHVVYPWNEPDTLVWNAVRARAEPGWHVVPPDWCLKNRSLQRGEAVQVCDSPHVPTNVLWAFLDDCVVLIDVAHGRSLQLSGTGGDFWRELATTGSVTTAATAVASQYDVDRSLVLGDVECFAATLRDGGWWRDQVGD